VPLLGVPTVARPISTPVRYASNFTTSIPLKLEDVKFGSVPSLSLSGRVADEVIFLSASVVVDHTTYYCCFVNIL
jgi:hypothetical protein